MIWTIVGAIYIASVLIARYFIKKHFSHYDQGAEAFFVCVIPILNTVTAFAFAVVFFIDKLGPTFNKVADWFFGNK